VKLLVGVVCRFKYSCRFGIASKELSIEDQKKAKTVERLVFEFGNHMVGDVIPQGDMVKKL
jgi:hypothetical protein